MVVVGAGPGGAATVTALRAEGYTGAIVLIGDEPHAPYDRPPLSKQVLASTWPVEKVTLRTAADLASAGIEFRPSCRALAVESDAHRVDLDDGSTVGYDALVIATGVTARRLPFGHELAGIHLLRTLDDTVALRTDLIAAGPVVVIGAGFLGAEAAAVCRTLEHGVSLVDTAELPLQQVLGDDLGSTPAVGWLADSGVPTSPDTGGIRCDEVGRAADDVWAIGDVAAWWNPQRGQHVRVEHRLTANEHARTVARDICGGERRDDVTVPYFWSDQDDLKLQSFGLPCADDTCRIVEGSLGDRQFVAVYTDSDGRVSGVVGAGMAKAVRTWRQAVADRSRLTSVLATTI